MDDVFLDHFQNACVIAKENLIKEYEDSRPTPVKTITLNSTQKNLLAAKILSLPDSYAVILFHKYVFKLDRKSTEHVLGISNLHGQLIYVLDLMRFAMQLPNNTKLDDGSVAKACTIALRKYIWEAKSNAASINPHYSAGFRKKLKMIKSVRSRRPLVLTAVQRAAAVLLVTFIGFTTTIMVNAEIRERFFAWIVNHYPQFSQFGVVSNKPPMEGDFDILVTYVPQYIPDGFVLQNEFAANPIFAIDYADEDNRVIYFQGMLSTGTLVSYNTEDVTVQELVYLNAPAYMWERGGLTYFLWQQDGYGFSIVSQLSAEEIVQIAESVKK